MTLFVPGLEVSYHISAIRYLGRSIQPHIGMLSMPHEFLEHKEKVQKSFSVVKLCTKLRQRKLQIQQQCFEGSTIRKAILQVPDTGTTQYCWILEHFSCTSIAWKYNLNYVLWKVLVLSRNSIYQNANMVQYSSTNILDFKYTFSASHNLPLLLFFLLVWVIWAYCTLPFLVTCVQCYRVTWSSGERYHHQTNLVESYGSKYHFHTCFTSFSNLLNTPFAHIP